MASVLTGSTADAAGYTVGFVAYQKNGESGDRAVHTGLAGEEERIGFAAHTGLVPEMGKFDFAHHKDFAAEAGKIGSVVHIDRAAMQEGTIGLAVHTGPVVQEAGVYG